MVDNIDDDDELSIATSIIHHGHTSDLYIAPERLKKRIFTWGERERERDVMLVRKRNDGWHQ